MWAVVWRRPSVPCLLYTSDAASERSSVDLGGRRIIKKKSGRLVPELDRDLRRRPPLDEEGAEGLVAAMEGGSGLEEEAPAGSVVHGVGSHRLTVFRRPGAPSV